MICSAPAPHESRGSRLGSDPYGEEPERRIRDRMLPKGRLMSLLRFPLQGAISFQEQKP